jgi:eukaryotic-like serine/threonine-protein kinase
LHSHGQKEGRRRSFAVGMIQLAVDRFLELVGRSGLIEPERLSPVLAQWKREAAPNQRDDAEQCAAHLVRARLLTPWQAHKLLEGRHRGFLLGSYKLLDHLGSGGMSNVYLAEHVLMQRRVAIKVLPHNRVADADQLARFQFEGQAVAAMDHPNIVRAYDLGSEGRIHYLVMEYIDGSDLEALVERAGPLDIYTAADFIVQAAEGLDYAHAAGLVHRDIKPANLLVDRHGTVKILDMGLAKFLAEVRPVPTFEQHEEVLGTAEYLAPEQAVNSLAVDPRADIYGLGCTLYCLLTGHPPFSARTRGELITAHQHETAPSVFADRPDAPPALSAICAKMMEKAPRERYQSARDVVEALRAWLASERAAGRAAAAGAAPDHPRAAEPVSSSMRDTDSNLQETGRIGPLVGPSASTRSSDVLAPARQRAPADEPGRGSDVLSAGSAPQVVPPPRNTGSATIPTVVGSAPPASAAPEGGIASRGAPSHLGPYAAPRRRGGASPSGMQLLAAALLSALVIGALVLALFAFGR